MVGNKISRNLIIFIRAVSQLNIKKKKLCYSDQPMLFQMKS